MNRYVSCHFKRIYPHYIKNLNMYEERQVALSFRNKQRSDLLLRLEKHERHQLEFDDQSHLRGDRVRWFLNGPRLGTGASINEVAAPIMF